MRLKTYYKIYKLIGTGRFRYYGVQLLRILGMRYLVVRLDPNWLCNLRCRMCYFSRDNYKEQFIKPMSVELFSRIGGQLFKKTRMLFIGCGAEPLMSPDFSRYADIVSSYKIPFVSLVTNGQLLSNDIAESLIRNRFHEVIVSVDGARAKTYEKIRRGAKFSRLIENMQNLRDLKESMGADLPEIRFNFTGMKDNIDELPELIELAAELKVNTVRARYMSNWGGAIDYADQCLEEGQYKSVINKVKMIAEQAGVDFIFEGCMDSSEQSESSSQKYSSCECVLPWYAIYIRGDGKARCCNWYEYGQSDFSKQSLAGYEADATMKEIKHKLLAKPNESCLKICQKRFGGI